MASTARWGLKHSHSRYLDTFSKQVGMASTARWGLKHINHTFCRAVFIVGMASTARWGLKPFPNLA